MFCKYCGKELPQDCDICPNCGQYTDRVETVFESVPDADSSEPTSTDTASVKPDVKPYNTLAIIGFAIACASVVVGFFGLTSIAGIVISSIALHQIKTSGEDGKLFAIFGIVIGVASLLVSIFIIVTVLGFIDMLAFGFKNMGTL